MTSGFCYRTRLGIETSEKKKRIDSNKSLCTNKQQVIFQRDFVSLYELLLEVKYFPQLQFLLQILQFLLLSFALHFSASLKEQCPIIRCSGYPFVSIIL